MPRENLESNIGNNESAPDVLENTGVVDSGIDTSSDAISVLGESTISEKTKKGPSEKIKTSKNTSSGGKGKVVIKPPVGKVMPVTVEQQKSEIINVIELEISELKSKIKKSQAINDFESLSTSVAEVRSLTSILKSLLRASVDSVKDLWMKFVGGSSK